ncbi:MAG: DUF3592 domain-containing protein [Oscillospiraceae bacterium]|nr:DUF3592 domain-containing protein [Oscillospiraceae bacterium]
MNTFRFILFFINGIVFFACGLYVFHREKSIIKHGTKTRGIIVYVSIGRPTIEYETPQGLLRVQSIYYFYKPFSKKYVVGDVVELFYSNEKPKRYSIEGDTILQVMGIWFMLFGLLAIVGAVL